MKKIIQNGSHLKGWKIVFKYLLAYKREVVAMSILGIVIAFTIE